MTTITIERSLLEKLYLYWIHEVGPDELDDFNDEVRAALAAPATAQKPSTFIRERAQLEQEWCVLEGMKQQYKSLSAWHDAPTEPGMWACLYMGELSTAIFNAYEIEHFDRDEMVGCRWRFIPEDK